MMKIGITSFCWGFAACHGGSIDRHEHSTDDIDIYINMNDRVELC
jgi:hypothetical protein